MSKSDSRTANETPLTDAAFDRGQLERHIRNVIALLDLVEDLERQLEDARKDTERLDWLEECGDMEKFNRVGELLMTKPLTVPEAIDNAMKEDEQ